VEDVQILLRTIKELIRCIEYYQQKVSELENELKKIRGRE